MSKNLSVVVKRKKSYYSIANNKIDIEWCDYDKYELLDAKAQPVTDIIYDRCGEEELKEDYYGNGLLEITIKDFLEIYTIDQPNVYDKAALTYLAALPQDDFLLLFYH
jgi:hypothetical protein